MYHLCSLRRAETMLLWCELLGYSLGYELAFIQVQVQMLQKYVENGYRILELVPGAPIDDGGSEAGDTPVTGLNEGK